MMLQWRCFAAVAHSLTSLLRIDHCDAKRDYMAQWTSWCWKRREFGVYQKDTRSVVLSGHVQSAGKAPRDGYHHGERRPSV